MPAQSFKQFFTERKTMVGAAAPTEPKAAKAAPAAAAPSGWVVTRNDIQWGAKFAKQLGALTGAPIRVIPTADPINTVTISFQKSDEPYQANLLMIRKDGNGVPAKRSAKVVKATGIFAGKEAEIDKLIQQDTQIWFV